MKWTVEFHDDFVSEFRNFEEDVQDEIYAKARLLEAIGPALGRPHCDKLQGSKLANLKELRFKLPDGEWRVAFAFDSRRKAILLCGGSKSGIVGNRFYRILIRKAEERFRNHANKLKE